MLALLVGVLERVPLLQDALVGASVGALITWTWGVTGLALWLGRALDFGGFG